MTEGKYTSETSIRVYNDATGDYVYVGPDADGGDLIEVRSHAGKPEQVEGRLVFEKNQALMVADAIRRLLGRE